MRERLAGGDRAVSTTIGYVLALTITALLISGLLLAAGGYVESQRDRVSREELTVIGERVAMGVQDVDRMAGSADLGSTIYVRVTLPGTTAGASYSINVTQVSNQTNQPYAYELLLRSSTLGVRETVPLRTHHELATNTVTGDDIVIAYRDYDNDSIKEIVIQKEMDIPRPIGPHLVPHTQVVFGNNSYLHTTGVGDPVKTYNGTPSIIGPAKADFDGDGLVEIPFVDSGGALTLIDTNNETSVLVSSGPKTDNARMSVGRWKGSKLSVFYVPAGQNSIYRVTAEGTKVKITEGDGNGIQSVSGIADIDGDGADELIFVDDSQQHRYLDDDGTIHKIENAGSGQNYGPGTGSPQDFNGNGEARVPFVDGSNNLKLSDAGGNVVTVVSGGVAKAPIASVDIDEDGQYEVVYLNSTGYAHYVDNLDEVGNSDGGPAVTKLLTTENNGTVHLDSGEREPGVA